MTTESFDEEIDIEEIQDAFDPSQSAMNRAEQTIRSKHQDLPCDDLDVRSVDTDDNVIVCDTCSYVLLRW
jgi:hypothetical protein